VVDFKGERQWQKLAPGRFVSPLATKKMHEVEVDDFFQGPGREITQRIKQFPAESVGWPARSVHRGRIDDEGKRIHSCQMSSSCVT
jgi:hypothetical protein